MRLPLQEIEAREEWIVASALRAAANYFESTTNRSGHSAEDALRDHLDICVSADHPSALHYERNMRQRMDVACTFSLALVEFFSTMAITSGCEVERLADELADMTGESRTATILHALEERRKESSAHRHGSPVGAGTRFPRKKKSGQTFRRIVSAGADKG